MGHVMFITHLLLQWELQWMGYVYVYIYVIFQALTKMGCRMTSLSKSASVNCQHYIKKIGYP